MSPWKMSAAIAMSAAANILNVATAALLYEPPKPRQRQRMMTKRADLPEESSWRTLFPTDYEAE